MWKRSILSSPGYAFAVILTLALGIGANSAIFSLIDAVVLRPLPYPESGQLLMVFQRNERLHEELSGFSPVRIEEIATQSQTLQGFAGHYTDTISETSGPVPQRLAVAYVTAGFFELFRAVPVAGHPFNEQERRYRHPADAVMISHRFWVERFQADPNLAGKALRVGKGSIPIAGVMPQSFAFPNSSIDVWRTVNFEDALYADPSIRFLTATARVKHEFTEEQSRSELAALVDRLDQNFPQKDKGWSIGTARLQTFGAEKYTLTLQLLFGAVGLLLLLACANVAALTLSRLDTRARELNVRAALGASRGQILRHLLAESLCLSLAGACLGLLLAQWLVALFRDWVSELPRGGNITVDLRVVVFTFAVAVLSTLLFSLLPAWRASGVSGMNVRTATAPDSAVRRYLVAVQLGLSMILLTGAALLGRTFWELSSTPTGFRTSGVTAFRITAAWGESNVPENVQARFLRTLTRLREIPGVESASIAVTLPPSGIAQETNYRVNGKLSTAQSRSVSGGYFATLGIPVLQGSPCADEVQQAQAPGAPRQPVDALVNQSFAERYLQGLAPDGQMIFGEAGNASPFPFRIRGVVADVREEGQGIAPKPTVYSCGLPGYYPDPVFLVRAKPGIEINNKLISSEVREVSPTRAVYSFQTLDGHLGDSIATQRRNAMLFGGFSLTALLLAAIGLFAVMNQSVQGRRREIGVRLAVGASPAHIGIQFVKRAAVIFALGASLGIAGSLILSRFIVSMLYQTSPLDPLVLFTVPLVLLLVSALAAYRPTRRAVTVDPIESLRVE